MKELQAALIDLGLPLDTPAHANAVAEFQASGATGVDVKQFKALIKGVKEQVAAGYTAPPAMLKSASSAAGLGGTGETVGAVFRRMDKDGGGTLDLSELSAALTDIGLPMASSLEKAKIELASTSATGLDLKRFKSLVKEIKADVAVGLKVKAETVGAVFRRMDKDGAIADLAELNAALTDLGLALDTPALATTKKELETTHQGGISMKQFKALVKAVKADMAEKKAKPETVGEVFRRMDMMAAGLTRTAHQRLNDLGLPLDTPAHANAVAELRASGATGLDVKQFKALIKALKAMSPA